MSDESLVAKEGRGAAVADFPPFAPAVNTLEDTPLDEVTVAGTIAPPFVVATDDDDDDDEEEELSFWDMLLAAALVLPDAVGPIPVPAAPPFMSPRMSDCMWSIRGSCQEFFAVILFSLDNFKTVWYIVDRCIAERLAVAAAAAEDETEVPNDLRVDWRRF